MWAGFCFPFSRGVGLFIWQGCLVACLLALAVYHMPGVGLLVIDFVSG